ncbi:transcriptional regulator MntR [Tepidibacillus fermentans]|uniref:Manganese transport regulator n=1 Tax=Tepidibacillus fermentans TaxID=1281767 RepID=A0A4R3KKI4_9BACI|nr:transcriptional regulator MntR [Tepidibacillus fermentans]TCS84012.1 DtxR family iron (metal) dependent repressor [Tepidibacillus fermentans]
MPTPSMEDYLERIYTLIQEKGYARVSDIAEALEVQPSSVTKMIQKLDKDEYLIYEKYRGLILTPKGENIGKKLVDRHTLLEEFLRMIGIEDEKLIYQDVEGIEHHLSWESIDAIQRLVMYLKQDKEFIDKFNELKKALDDQDLV